VKSMGRLHSGNFTAEPYLFLLFPSSCHVVIRARQERRSRSAGHSRGAPNGRRADEIACARTIDVATAKRPNNSGRSER